MADEKNVDLREKARTEYGIVNADQMQEEQLKAEMKAIDDMPATAENEDTSTETASDPSNDAPEDGNEDEDEETPTFTTRNSREELEAEAARLEVDGDVRDREAYPNKEALVNAINSKQA